MEGPESHTLKLSINRALDDFWSVKHSVERRGNQSNDHRNDLAGLESV
jgi:hypothetical protein